MASTLPKRYRTTICSMVSEAPFLLTLNYSYFFLEIYSNVVAFLFFPLYRPWSPESFIEVVDSDRGSAKTLNYRGAHVK